MTETILSRMVNCDTTTQIWKTLQQYLVAQNQAKVNQCKTQLQKIKKESLGMNDFQLKIRSLVDHPALVGHELSPKDYIDAIFEALPQNMTHSLHQFHIDSYTIDESWNTGKKKFGDFSNNPFGGFDSQYGQGQGFFSSPSSFRGNLNFSFNKNSHNCNRGRGNGQFGGRGRHGGQYGGRGS
ncbi:hypothetical protein AAG906_009767 [Vitis piasezkii]